MVTIIRYSSTCLQDSRDQSMTSKNIPPKVISCHKPASYHFVLKFILCLTGQYNIIESLNNYRNVVNYMQISVYLSEILYFKLILFKC